MNKVVHIVFFLFFLKSFSVIASVKDSLTIKIDSTRIAEKHFASHFSEKYNGSDFKYDAMEGEAENFLVRILKAIINTISDIFGIQISPEIYNLVEIIMYCLLIFLVMYILVRLLAGQNATSFFTRKSSMVAPLNISEEHIENIDLDQYIKDALAEKNYRLAIRYMYLKALKQLSQHHLIEWHFDKTNTDYYREIENGQLKGNFKKVSYLYDYIWYGEFNLDATAFKNAEKDFERFSKTISNA